MKRVSRFFLLLALVAVPPVHADSIGILGGQFEHDFGAPPVGGPLVLTGERGFTFRSTNSFALTFLGWPCQPELFGLACVPGFAVLSSAALAPQGVATLDGLAVPNVLAGDLRMQLNSSVVLPPLAPTATATGTFRVDPTGFNVFNYIDGAGNPQTARFVGLGSVTLSLTRNEQFPTTWNVARATYEFTSVPEPATVFLVMTGMGLLGVRRSYRRKRNDFPTRVG